MQKWYYDKVSIIPFERRYLCHVSYFRFQRSGWCRRAARSTGWGFTGVTLDLIVLVIVIVVNAIIRGRRTVLFVDAYEPHDQKHYQTGHYSND